MSIQLSEAIKYQQEAMDITIEWLGGSKYYQKPINISIQFLIALKY